MTREIILDYGRKRFGPPSPDQEAEVNALTHLDRLASIRDNRFNATSWDELLKPEY